jgi:signal transduction histidine kinase
MSLGLEQEGPKFWQRIRRPRLWQNGLVLVLLPLVINTVWIVLLADSLQKSEGLIAQERYQAVIESKLNELVFVYAKGFSDLVTSFLQQRRGYLKNAQNAFTKVQAGFIELNTLTARDQEVHHWVARAQEDWEKSFKTLERIAEVEAANADSPIPWLGQLKQAQAWSRDFHEINREIFGVIDKERAKLDDIRKAQNASREQLQLTVIIGLAANFAVAALLLWLFARNIGSRVKILMQNAVRLPQNQPLENRVSGLDELAELDDVLHQASKQIADATEFRQSMMQMMAHDLRAPLSSSMVSVDLILRSDGDILSESAHKHIRAISRSTERLINLINDLLTLESLEAGKIDINPSPENIKEIVDVGLESMRSLAEIKPVQLVSDVQRQYLLLDRERVLQVLINLISNAIKFSPPGGAVHISAKQNGREIKIAVGDEGIGLSKEDRKKLFQKFFQSDAGKKAGGSGLGLSICKLIVESHGGTIGVISNEEGSGSTFWFTLPLQAIDNDDDDDDDED